MVDINQFALSQVQGALDLQIHSSVISCTVDAAETTQLVAGQAVKLATTGGGTPKVLALTSNTDKTFGFVVRNLKDQSRGAGESLEIAMAGSVMYMTAGAAVTAGAYVEIVYATNKVITSAGANPIVGYSLDNASADGDLIRVMMIEAGSVTAGQLQSITVTATLAEINAGKTLIPAVSGKSIKVTDYIMRVSGGWATATSVDLQSSNATPVKVNVALIAALTNGAVIVPPTANVTLSAGFGVALGSGDALKVVNVGTAGTGGTSITYTITYAIV